MSMYGVNAGIPKTLVRHLVRWVADNHFSDIGDVRDILMDIIDTPISPELLPADDKGLVIWPTHRLIKSGNISEKNAVKGVSAAFRTEEVPVEELLDRLPGHMMGIRFRSGKCLLADLDDDGGNEMMNLDTYAVQQRILYGVYKSDEGKADISYDAEADDVMRRMDAGEFDAAVLLNPPSLDTSWDLSMKGKRMPKKTTFFFPKIWSGFVIYQMD